MKAFTRVLCLGLIVALVPTFAFGALGRNKQNVLGKFYASNVKGTVIVIVDGRITELRKGTWMLARGTVVDAGKDASATLVFSNGTGVYVDANTKFTVKIFEQEFFAPNNNLRVEPSNSNTVVLLDHGRVVISTPRLLSGTTMIYETDLAAVNIRGDKVMIETDEKQTHVAMISGNASVNPRGPDGNFVSIGRRLKTGNEAFVKFTLGGESEDASRVVQAEEGVAAGGLKMGTAAEIGGRGPSTPPVISSAAVTQETEATVLHLTGFARTKLPGATEEVQLSEGSRLPKGAIITTDESSELYLQPFPGTIATIRPKSTVQIEKLSQVVDDGVVKKESALLFLSAGSIISTIDPAKRATNDYGVRTAKGLATAHGTSFTVSVEGEDGTFVATTADSVVFTLPTGDTYTIAAGAISVTPPGGQPQTPQPIGQALAANPALAGAIQTAVTTVANVVQNNIGNLPSASATNLLTQVLQVATSALPDHAVAFASQAVTAVTAPGSATGGEAALAAATVTGAVVASAPTQAAQIAVAAASSAPAQTNVVAAAAAAHASPDQAAQVANAVAHTLVNGPVTSDTAAAASELASAIAAAVPAKSAPVAAAVMQALAVNTTSTPPQEFVQIAATIAAGVTKAVPDQAVPVAATMMQLVTQAAPNATPLALAQSGAVLASAVTAVVPDKAQPVATAVMQSIVNQSPTATPESTIAAAGLIASAVSAVAPDQAASVVTGISSAINQPAGSVQVSAAAASATGSQLAQSGQGAANSGSQAGQTGAAAAAIASQGSSNAASFAQGDNGGSSSSSSSGGQGGNGGNGSVASTSGSGNSSSGNGGNGSGSGNSGSSGSGNSSNGNSGGGDSGNAGSGSGSSGNGGTGGIAGTGTGTDTGTGAGTGTGGTGDTSTSITVTDFDPGSIADLVPDSGSPSGSDTPTPPTNPDPGPPVVPPVNPPEFTESSANTGG